MRYSHGASPCVRGLRAPASHRRSSAHSSSGALSVRRFRTVANVQRISDMVLGFHPEFEPDIAKDRPAVVPTRRRDAPGPI